MAEDKKFQLNDLWLFLPEVICILAAFGFVFFYSRFRGDDLTNTLEYAVVILLGVSTVGAGLRKEFFSEEHVFFAYTDLRNFWLCFAAGLIMSVICVFLPVECWPFVPVFVLLSLLGDVPYGILSASMLLLLPALMTGQTEAFFVYLPAGILAVFFFCPVKNEMKVIMPLTICMSGLFVLETAIFIVTQNSRPSWEMFLMPVINLIISAIILLGIMRTYSRKILYRFRDRYLEINDTENPVMAALREKDKDTYKKSIHITHFCEVISMKLGYDTDAIKTAGYYHVFGDRIRKIQREQKFPPEAVRILNEYLTVKKAARSGALKSKETAILICSEAVVNTVMQLIRQDPGKKYDFDKVITMIFKRFEDADYFSECNIPVRDLRIVENTFREGKLYYDFLR